MSAERAESHHGVVVAASICAGLLFAAAPAHALSSGQTDGGDGTDAGLYRERLSHSGAITDGHLTLEFGDDAGEFTVRAPPGWVLDRKSGASQKLRAVFYPKDGSWVSSQAVMYVKTVIRCDACSLDAFIKREAEDFVRGSDSKVSSGRSIKTGAGRAAPVRNFLGGHGSNFESAAYIQEPSAFIVVVLSAQTAKAQEGAQNAFTQLVRSYQSLPPTKSRAAERRPE